MKMHKRGAEHELILMLGQLLLGAAFIVGMFMYLGQLRSDTSLEQRFYARDISLLLSTVQSAPGSILFTYPRNIAEYELSMEYQNHKIYAHKHVEDQFSYATLLSNHALPERTLLLEPSVIMLSKQGKSLQLSKDTLSPGVQLDCPDFEAISPIALIISPGDFPGEQEVIRAQFMPEEITVVSPRDARPSGTVIMVKAEQAPEMSILAYVQYPSERFNATFAYACHLLNAFAEQSSIPIFLIPSSSLPEFQNPEPPAIVLVIRKPVDSAVPLSAAFAQLTGGQNA
ncbi:hypothetical protein J4464_06735 [Candidatus Woesearchaeota archaeon]|nr:hypothetical protein [Candidatus Woesearchaeota archaeon]